MQLLSWWGDRFPIASYCTIFPECSAHSLFSLLSCRALSPVHMYDIHFHATDVQTTEDVMNSAQQWSQAKCKDFSVWENQGLTSLNLSTTFLLSRILSHFLQIFPQWDQNPKKKREIFMLCLCMCTHECGYTSTFFLTPKPTKNTYIYFLSKSLLTNFPDSKLTTNNRIAWKILDKT